MSKRAIIIARSQSKPVEVEEITQIAEAAGYEVVMAITQAGREDSGTFLGAGKVNSLTSAAAERDIDLVVADSELTPSQTRELNDRLPQHTTIYDRYRLILDIFAEQANTKKASMQVELARLKYELPLITEKSDPQTLNKALEKGTRLDDAKTRISKLEKQLLESNSDVEAQQRTRKELGFDIVAIAGYTNAGKSTLLHRVADDLDLESTIESHPDREETAAIEDRLFKTLETTTRRATIDGRPTVMTDTVGFVQDLPHWLVKSFSGTLSEISGADVVILVADVSDDEEQFREKLSLSAEVLRAQNVDLMEVLLVLNKCDLVSEATVDNRIVTAGEWFENPIPVSLTKDESVDGLRATISEKLTTESARIVMPNRDEAMTVVSWAHDHLIVENEEYTADEICLEVAGRPEVIQRCIGKKENAFDS